MSYKKLRTFSLFLLLGIAALFFPATALQNSIASGQEYYPEYEENEYTNQEYDTYSSYNDNKGPIINVEKNLFICDDVIDNSSFFECSAPTLFFFPAGPDSGQYIPCNDEICQSIDESDFGAQIFKDVATVRDLSPEGVPVNIDKFHYTVTEGFIDERISTGNQCFAVGFDHGNSYLQVLENGTIIFNDLCIKYEGDCEGTIYSDEEKTCTIDNYIVDRFTIPPPFEHDDNTGDDTQSLLQQSNNQAVQYHFKTLKDVMNNREN